MRKLVCWLYLVVGVFGLTSLGCGPSYQSEDAARELVEQEDAAEDIEAEIAAEEAGE